MTNGAANPNQGRFDAAQKKLRQAKVQLLKAKATLDDDDYYETLAPEDQPKALLRSMQIGPEILKMENAQIALVVEKVEANAADLDGATKELREALGEVENVSRVLNAITSVLGVVARILTIV